jgi:hypothetical protein
VSCSPFSSSRIFKSTSQIRLAVPAVTVSTSSCFFPRPVQQQGLGSACPKLHPGRTARLPLGTARDMCHPLYYFDSRFTNAFSESANNIIKDIEKQGKGYSFDTLRDNETITKDNFFIINQQSPPRHVTSCVTTHLMILYHSS